MKKVISKKIGALIPIFILALILGQFASSGQVEAQSGGEGYFSHRVIIGQSEDFQLFLSGDPEAYAETGFYWGLEDALMPHIDAIKDIDELAGPDYDPRVYFSAGDKDPGPGVDYGDFEIQAKNTFLGGHLIMSGDLIIGGDASTFEVCLNPDGVGIDCITDWSEVPGDSLWTDGVGFIYPTSAGGYGDTGISLFDTGAISLDGGLTTGGDIVQTFSTTYLKNLGGDVGIDAQGISPRYDAINNPPGSWLGSAGNRWSALHTVDAFIHGGQNFEDTTVGDQKGVITWGGLDLAKPHVDSAGGNLYLASDSGANTVELQGNVHIAAKDILPNPKLHLGDTTPGRAGQLCLYGTGAADCRSIWPPGDIGGGGTQNYIPKFADATTLDNSIIYQGNYVNNLGDGTDTIGLNTNSPMASLDVQGGPVWTASGWRRAIKLSGGNSADAIEFDTGGDNETKYGIGASPSSDMLYIFTTETEGAGGSVDSAHYRFIMNPDGRIQIGPNVSGPHEGMLSVGGDLVVDYGGVQFSDTMSGNTRGMIAWNDLALDSAHIDYSGGDDRLYIATEAGDGMVVSQGDFLMEGNDPLLPPKMHIGHEVIPGQLCLYGTGAADCRNVWPSGGTADGDWAATIGGDPTLTGEVYHTGNVAIGRDNPAYPLDVAGDAQIRGQLRLTGAGIMARAVGVGEKTFLIADGPFRFWSGEAPEGGSQVLEMNPSTGNIGIGNVDNPLARLAVSVNSALNPIGSAGDAIAAYTNSDTAAIYAEQQGLGWAGSFSGDVKIGNLGQTRKICLNTDDHTTNCISNWSEVGGDSDWTIDGVNMYSTPTGNVSIGTTTPNAKLQVIGAISRQGTTLIGANAASHVNLGEDSTTGAAGLDHIASTVSGGRSNTAGNDGATVSGGFGNIASGYASTVVGGMGNTSSGLYAVSGGTQNTAEGLASITLGNNCYAGNSGAIAMGFAASAAGVDSVAIGSGVTASAQNAFVLGHEVNTGEDLENNIQDSLMVGFHSTIPTFFVGPSSGIGTTGNVGIATTSPQEKLEVSGGNIYVSDNGSGLILKNSVGICSQIGIDATGNNLTATPVPCP